LKCTVERLNKLEENIALNKKNRILKNKLIECAETFGKLTAQINADTYET